MRKKIFITYFMLFVSIHFFDLFGREIQPFGKLGEVYVISDNASLFEKPSASSKELLKVPIFRCVRILDSKSTFSSNEGKKEWYYVDSGIVSNESMVNTKEGWKYITIKGWIERKYLAGKDDFRKVSKINEMFVSILYTEDGIDFHIRSDGTFSYKFGDDPKLYYGNIYQCKKNTNFFSFNHMEFFYYLIDNVIEVPSPAVSDIKILTDKSQFPDWAKSDTPPVLDEYAILTGDNVNVRAEATTNSKVLLQLKKGTKVKVLERSDVEFIVDNKTGHWVYIDTGVKDKKGKTIKGWVVDIYLKPKE